PRCAPPSTETAPCTAAPARREIPAPPPSALARARARRARPRAPPQRPLRRRGAMPRASRIEAAPQRLLVGDDRLHRHVVRLRINRIETAVGETHADRERTRLERGERAVVIAAAVAQAMAGFVEADQRYQQRVGRGRRSLRRDGNAPYLLPSHARSGIPAPEFERPAFLHDDREGGLCTLFEQPSHDRPQIRLAPQRPVKADTSPAAEVHLFETFDDASGRLHPRFGGLIHTLADESLALLHAPAPDLLPVVAPNRHVVPHPPAP